MNYLGFFGYACVVLIIVHSALKRNKLELAIYSVPFVFCTYFILSIFIFTFGEDMPFTYFSTFNYPYYNGVILIICSHFTAVFLAFRTSDALMGSTPYFQRNGINPSTSFISRYRVGPMGALACLLPVLFIYLTMPAGTLWYRDVYFVPDANYKWMTFADMGFFPAAVSVPFIKGRAVRYFVLASLFLSFTAIGSRSAIVLLAVFLAFDILVVKRCSWLSILFFSVILIHGAAINMYFREINIGGLKPYFESFVSFDSTHSFRLLIYSLNYVFNLSFALIGEMMSYVRSETRWFYYAINPLPSFLAGDVSAEYDDHSRFRRNIPYPGLGYIYLQLGHLGHIFVVYITAAAFLLYRRIIMRNFDLVEAVICFSFFIFPFLILLQYNLRTGMRLIYMFIFFYTLFAVWRRIK